MQEIMRYLKVHGELLDSEIASGTGIPLAKVSRSVSDLSAKGEVIMCRLTRFTDGKKIGEGDIGATLAMIFSADDGCDIGEDSGAPVSPDYGPQGNAFNGQVRGVQLASIFFVYIYYFSFFPCHFNKHLEYIFATFAILV